MFNHYDDHFKFWNMDGVTFPNARYVHPLKQRDIQNIYDQLIQDKNITLLVVFGSSVDFRCHSESDIDLYMERNDKERYPKLEYSFQSDIDRIYDIQDFSKGLGKSIAEEGIVLFDRRETDV